MSSKPENSVLLEPLEKKRDLFVGVVLGAVEEIDLANAIREGRQNEFVGEREVLALLRGRG